MGPVYFLLAYLGKPHSFKKLQFGVSGGHDQLLHKLFFSFWCMFGSYTLSYKFSQTHMWLWVRIPSMWGLCWWVICKYFCKHSLSSEACSDPGVPRDPTNLNFHLYKKGLSICMMLSLGPVYYCSVNLILCPLLCIINF